MFEAECRRALSADDSYAHDCGPLSPELICLLTCADACRVTLSAIMRGEGRLHEVGAWCADVCREGVGLAEGMGRQGAALAAAAGQCAAYCADLAAACAVPLSRAEARAHLRTL